jgi:hypothetical protein
VEFSLVFTNDTAELVVTTNKTYNSATYSTMTLRFKAESRDDARLHSPRTGQPLARERYPIQLNTNDANLPKFEFLNGSSIYFANLSSQWVAAGVPISDPTSSDTSKNAAARATRATGGFFSLDVTVVMTMVLLFMMI